MTTSATTSATTVTLLGVRGGPRIVKNEGCQTCSLLEMAGRALVIDCGIGVSRRLAESDTDFSRLSDIFITHLHSDHTLELGPLIYSAWTSAPLDNIRIFGPPGTKNLMDHFFESQSFDRKIRVEDEKQTDLRDMITVIEFVGEPKKPFTVHKDDQVEVTALQVVHPPITDTYALKFVDQESGKTVVFSSDTAYHPPLADFAAGADLLVHEAMLGHGVDKICAELAAIKPNLRAHLMASHTLAPDVGRIASAAKVKHLAINHMVPVSQNPTAYEDEIRTTWDGPLTVGVDLCRIEV